MNASVALPVRARCVIVAAAVLVAFGCSPRDAAPADDGRAAGGGGVARVVAAASMRDALEEIARTFEERHAGAGWRVERVYTASGAAYQQILSGAPFHLFVAADALYPRALDERRLAEAGSRRVYACGALALWRARGSNAGSNDAGATMLASLAAADVRRVAIANPETAPYGRAAMEVLRAAGLEAAVRPKLVMGQDAAQAAQIALAGADAALLPRSAMAAPAFAARGSWTLVDPSLHAPLAHSLVLVRRDDAPVPAAARALHAMLLSGAVAAPLRRFGYALPHHAGDGALVSDDTACDGVFDEDGPPDEPREGAR